MGNQLGLGIVLKVHVVHRQFRRTARDDLLKNACAQRVEVQRTSIGVRHLHLDAAAQRDGRIELLHLRERHLNLRTLNAHVIVAVAVVFQCGVLIVRRNLIPVFTYRGFAFKAADCAPVGMLGKTCLAFALAVILPREAAQKRVLVRFAHLVKADDQRPRQSTVHLSVRHTGLDDGRTVLQRVSACCTRGRQKRTDLRQQQHRQQARQQTLQFFSCHNSFLLSFFSPEQQPVPIRLVVRHE